MVEGTKREDLEAWKSIKQHSSFFLFLFGTSIVFTISNPLAVLKNTVRKTFLQDNLVCLSRYL